MTQTIELVPNVEVGWRNVGPGIWRCGDYEARACDIGWKLFLADSFVFSAATAEGIQKYVDGRLLKRP